MNHYEQSGLVFYNERNHLMASITKDANKNLLPARKAIESLAS